MAKENLSPLDVALIHVGEKTGTLTEVERMLCQFYEERHELERSVRSALVKPGLLFLASIFLRDLPALFGKTLSVTSYTLRTFGVIAVVAMGLMLLFHFYRLSYRSRQAGELWVRLLLPIPWFGGVAKTIAMERFFTCLQLGLSSGCDLYEMLELGAKMTALPALKEKAAPIIKLSRAKGLADAFSVAGIFSRQQVLLVRTGEQAGQLEEAFKKITHDLRDEVRAAIRAFEQWLPRIIYGFAMLYALSGVFMTIKGILKIHEDQFKAIQ